MTKIKFEKLAVKEFGRIEAFHLRVYGSSSYQASVNYLQWLYVDNPFQDNDPTCLTAVTEDGTVVGCIHVMCLGAEHHEQRLRIHSLQNLIVDEDYRSGMGILMVKQAMKAADITIFPGVAPALSNAYKAMKYPEVKSFWGRKVLRPVGVVWGLLGERFGFHRQELQIMRHSIERVGRGAIEILVYPDDGILTALAAAMIARDRALQTTPILWTAQTLRWRFFSSRGPFHLLFVSADRQYFCIASLGLRRNVRVSRLVEVAGSPPLAFSRRVMGLLKSLGAELSLSYAGRDSEKNMLISLGYAEVSDTATSFVVDKVPLEWPLALTSGATDVGLESLNTIAVGFGKT
jgi:hypothetical protein